jgi:hypothetical protein
MAGPRKRAGKRGPRPPRSDDADPETSRMPISSSLHEYRTAPLHAGERPDKNSHPSRDPIPAPRLPRGALAEGPSAKSLDAAVSPSAEPTLAR